MKKIYLFILLFLTILILQAQEKYVILTTNGFENIKTPDQKYIILDFEGFSQKELYDNVLAKITTMPNSFKNTINKIENEIISIDAEVPNKVIYKRGLDPIIYFDLDYSLSFSFKDNKMKIDLPVLNNIYLRKTHNNSGFLGLNLIHTILVHEKASSLTGTASIYNRGGKLRLDKTKQSVEKYFNDYINEIAIYIKSNKKNNW